MTVKYFGKTFSNDNVLKIYQNLDNKILLYSIEILARLRFDMRRVCLHLENQVKLQKNLWQVSNLRFKSFNAQLASGICVSKPGDYKNSVKW